MSQKEIFLSRAHPLGRPHIEVAYQRTFSSAEAEKLRAGWWPTDMDDKWVVFLGELSLDMWRSWTGIHIYSLQARFTEGGVSLGPLLVNGDRTQYRRVSDENDTKFVDEIITWILRDEKNVA